MTSVQLQYDAAENGAKLKRLLVALAIAAPIALLVTPASAAPASIQIGSCRAHGQFAICDASGNARNHPVTIVLHVRSVPDQSVSGAWDMTCAKGLGAGSSSGRYNSGTPINRILHKPYLHPDNCIVSADGQLAHGGSLHIWLTYTS